MKFITSVAIKLYLFEVLILAAGQTVATPMKLTLRDLFNAHANICTSMRT